MLKTVLEYWPYSDEHLHKQTAGLEQKGSHYNSTSILPGKPLHSIMFVFVFYYFKIKFYLGNFLFSYDISKRFDIKHDS